MPEEQGGQDSPGNVNSHSASENLGEILQAYLALGAVGLAIAEFAPGLASNGYVRFLLVATIGVAGFGAGITVQNLAEDRPHLMWSPFYPTGSLIYLIIAVTFALLAAVLWYRPV